MLNLSLSGPRDRLLERLIDRAAERGVAVVGAVDPAAPDRSFPASHPRVIAVAVGDDPRLPDHAILAPGRAILTTVPAGGWGWFSGASFAAAHVAGIAALLIETRPSLSGEEIRAVLQSRGERASPRRRRAPARCLRRARRGRQDAQLRALNGRSTGGAPPASS